MTNLVENLHHLRGSEILQAKPDGASNGHGDSLVLGSRVRGGEQSRHHAASPALPSKRFSLSFIFASLLLSLSEDPLHDARAVVVLGRALHTLDVGAETPVRSFEKLITVTGFAPDVHDLH